MLHGLGFSDPVHLTWALKTKKEMWGETLKTSSRVYVQETDKHLLILFYFIFSKSMDVNQLIKEEMIELHPYLDVS